MRRLSLLFVAVLSVSAQTGTLGGVPPGAGMPPSAASATPSEIKPEDLGSIEGQVFHSVTGEPLNKASLTLTRADQMPGPNGPPKSYATASDGTGRFLIREVEPGRYRLRAMRTGFVPAEYGSRSATRSGTTITVERAKNVKALELRL